MAAQQVDQHCEVAVVGGGPVGMLLAGELRLHGVDVVVIESKLEVSRQPKAGTYHARAIQTLARRGILRFPLGETDHTKISREPFQFAGYPWLGLRTAAVEGPVMIGLAQADLERALSERAATLGVTIRRGHTVRELHSMTDGVVLTVTDEDGVERSLRANYVVGCDGARSIVRTHGRFETVEYPPTMRAMLGMARLPHPEQLRPGWQQTPRGWTLLNLNRFGSSRIITFEFDGPDADRRKPITAAEFGAAVDRIVGSHVELADLEYTSRFNDFSRLARNYRDGRLFLAGDAAHVHFPLGGQGLNTGLQDAVNLGWKLVAVLRYGAQSALLDTYMAERQPVAAQVVDNTRVQSMLMNPRAEHNSLRAFIGDLLSSPDAHDRVADVINGESLRYPATEDAGQHAGSFFRNLTLDTTDGPITVAELLTAGRSVLLVSAREAAHADTELHHGLIDVVLVERIPEDLPPTVLLRPDGYVAWSGSLRGGAAGLREAVVRWFGAPLPAATRELS
ncbi:FAD-dependent monooxygenase [Nocardia australiensis]|uniref:FAD-dependent monooxygenase n=1 Tax=Nocardia australiensis TaxID=2887191 RepID=UPI001D1573F8|nr:FAD-dependent monooxygenase [Nocardia australiensis]